MPLPVQPNQVPVPVDNLGPQTHIRAVGSAELLPVPRFRAWRVMGREEPLLNSDRILCLGYGLERAQYVGGGIRSPEFDGRQPNRGGGTLNSSVGSDMLCCVAYRPARWIELVHPDEEIRSGDMLAKRGLAFAEDLNHLRVFAARAFPKPPSVAGLLRFDALQYDDIGHSVNCRLRNFSHRGFYHVYRWTGGATTVVPMGADGVRFDGWGVDENGNPIVGGASSAIGGRVYVPHPTFAIPLPLP